MSNSKHVKLFLGRLESSVNDKRGSQQALEVREAPHLNHHVQNNTWPGKDFLFIGNSQNLDHPLVGTEIHVQRRTCLNLLYEAKGDNFYCVTLEDALSFRGFVEVLSRFEREMLMRMPAQNKIGPAYNQSGEVLPAAFAVWRAQVQIPKGAKTKVLVKA